MTPYQTSERYPQGSYIILSVVHAGGDHQRLQGQHQLRAFDREILLVAIKTRRSHITPLINEKVHERRRREIASEENNAYQWATILVSTSAAIAASFMLTLSAAALQWRRRDASGPAAAHTAGQRTRICTDITLNSTAEVLGAV